LQFAVRPSYAIASELAASHAAIVDYISPDRDVLLVSYTSEPIIAEAAASIMETHLAAMLYKLESYFRSNFIDYGERSEYIARLFTILVADKVAKELPPSDIIYNRSISCHDYLVALIGDRLHSILDEHKKDSPNVKWSRFLEGKMFFTHFISCNYTPTLADLADFFKRGAAVLCKSNQASIDMIIPILLPTDAETNGDNQFYSPVLKKTGINLDLKGTATLPLNFENDGFDIPEKLLLFDPNINIENQPTMTNESAQNEPNSESSDLVASNPSSSSTTASQSTSTVNPNDQYMVSALNMSYILIQVLCFIANHFPLIAYT
jgi:hypothetical protein